MPTEFSRAQKIILVIVAVILFLVVAANIVARFVVPGIIQKQIEDTLQVPVRVQKAGINFATATFWMKGVEIKNIPGSSHPVFLSAKRIVINLSFTSLPARQLIFQKISFEEPVLNLERDKKKRLNSGILEERARSRFKPRIKFGKQHFFTGYEVNQFAIKNGIFSYLDLWAPEGQKRWRVHHATFSFSNLIYPPQLIDPVSTSLFLSAKIEGIREGSILVLGSGSFIYDRNFKIRSEMKNIYLREMNPFFPDFPLLMTDGYLDLKSEAISKNDLIEITNHLTIKDLKLEEKTDSKHKSAFGYSKKDIMELFDSLRGKPFSFDFRVAGDLNDPKLNFEKLTSEAMEHAIELQLKKTFNQLKQNVEVASEDYIPQRRTKNKTSNVSFKDAVERLTGIKIPGV